MAKTKREQLEKLVHDMQTLADECDEKGKFEPDDQQRMTAMAADAKRLKTELTAEAEASDTMADTKAFLASLGANPGADEPNKIAGKGGAPAPEKTTSLGEAFVESEAYKGFIKTYGGVDGVISSSTKGIQSAPMQMPGFKDLITGVSSTSAGAFVQNDRYAPVTDLIGERELTVRDLVTKGTTQSDTVEYVRVTSKTNNAAAVAEATTAAAGAISGASPGPYTVAAGSGTKPESALAFEVVSTTVKTIAHWIPITKRAASDAGQVRTLVDNFLRYGLAEEEEDQMLSGDGTGENLTGILNSGILTVGSAGTDLDAIVDAIRTVRVTGRRRPNGLVIHPNDWFSTGFVLAKDTAGNYLIADPANDPGSRPLWGLTPVITPAVPENTALVGDFRFAVLWDREQAAISVSDSHADFFVRNLLAILAEQREAFGILDPQAFCSVTAL
ncbi:MAG: phage major capsid protein [Actinomycetota bacterium]|nr:phage major capsid protein [Actinomycetota bacterium]